MIEVRRTPGTKAGPLPESAVPWVVAEALAHRQDTFLVDVAAYRAGLEEMTLPETLKLLTDWFA